MDTISRFQNVPEPFNHYYLTEEGYTRIHQGKVRDTYVLDNNQLLVVASDRISIFDFVLNAEVLNKGEVLTALTHFWMTKQLSEFQNHLVPSKKNNSFNAVIDLRGKSLPLLQVGNCLVVKNMKDCLYPFELIFRHHIGGSVFKTYQETGKAGGQELPPNLQKWSKLETPLFTPSTKAEVGHDVNVDANYFFEIMNQKGRGIQAKKVVEILIKAYKKAYAFAETKGILILDTKLEVAGPMIVDEILTPDSSRFTFKTDWEQSMKEGRDPQFLDKQPVRDWGSTITTPFSKNGDQIIGINKLDPQNSEHNEFVQNLVVPQEVIDDTTRRYLYLFAVITGSTLEEYQRVEMGV